VGVHRERGGGGGYRDCVVSRELLCWGFVGEWGKAYTTMADMRMGTYRYKTINRGGGTKP